MTKVECDELLSSMIDEYNKFCEKHSDAIAGDPDWKGLSEFMGAKTSLCKAIDSNRENPLIGACAWWRENQDRFLTEDQRVRHLWQLLTELDLVYSKKSIIRCGRLVLGRRWWNVACRCDTSNLEPGPLDGPELVRSYKFPHLRVVDVNEDEWVGLDKTKRAFEDVLAKCELRVGLCSLSGKAKTFFSGTRVLPNEASTAGFRAQGMKHLDDPTSLHDDGTSQSAIETCGDAYRDELRDAVRWAREKRIHILCFPELCVCEEGREHLRAVIESDPGELALVIPGSFHVNYNPKKYRGLNTAPVWLVVDGAVRPICDYEKVDPMAVRVARIKGGPLHSAIELARKSGCRWVKEDIRCGNSALFLETPIGVISIAICKSMRKN